MEDGTIIELIWKGYCEFFFWWVTFLTHRSQSQVTCLIKSFILSYMYLINLKKLASPWFIYCGLHGRFLDHDIHLPKLEVLNLRANYDLSGNFPRFSENNSLMELDLSITNLSGEISASIGNLQSLQTLDLSNCEFSGSIPTSISNLKSLQTLDLSYCQFSGSIPTSIGNLKSLQTLDLSNCEFSGSIPTSIDNLKSL